MYLQLLANIVCIDFGTAVKRAMVIISRIRKLVTKFVRILSERMRVHCLLFRAHVKDITLDMVTIHGRNLANTSIMEAAMEIITNLSLRMSAKRCALRTIQILLFTLLINAVFLSNLDHAWEISQGIFV